jgi:hypothetical protein
LGSSRLRPIAKTSNRHPNTTPFIRFLNVIAKEECNTIQQPQGIINYE